MSTWRTSIGDATKLMIRAAGKPLDDYLWSAAAADAIDLPDPSFSALALHVAKSISHAVLEAPVEPSTMRALLEPCERLLRHRRVSAMIFAAIAMKHVAELSGRFEEHLAIFEGLPSRQRCLMLRYSCPKNKVAVDYFVRRGLTDRAASVRVWASEAAVHAELRQLSPLVAAAAQRETRVEVAKWIQTCVWLLEKGYFLAPADNGLRNCKFWRLGSSSIRVSEIEELGEAEAVERHRQSLIPAQKAADDWVKRCLERSFEAWRQSLPPRAPDFV